MCGLNGSVKYNKLYILFILFIFGISFSIDDVPKLRNTI